MSDRHAHFRQTTPPVEKVGEEEVAGTPQIEESEPIPFSRYVLCPTFSGSWEEVGTDQIDLLLLLLLMYA
jgi:hypothetical protein